MFSVWLHAILQVLDGVLTFIGVNIFNGIDTEGNPLVHHLMTQLGALGALVVAKTFALLVLFVLWRRQSNARMLKRALVPLNLIYIISSLAWLYAFFQYYRIAYG